MTSIAQGPVLVTACAALPRAAAARPTRLSPRDAQCTAQISAQHIDDLRDVVADLGGE
jgi:hypothetical protein